MAQHPRATLDARASRVQSARQQANVFHLQMQQTEMRFQQTLSDIKGAYETQTKELEDHYHKQVDSVQAQYKAAMDEIRSKYRDAYDQLRREQSAFVDQAKHIDFKGEFIDHFPAPESTHDHHDGRRCDEVSQDGPRS